MAGDWNERILKDPQGFGVGRDLKDPLIPALDPLISLAHIWPPVEFLWGQR